MATARRLARRMLVALLLLTLAAAGCVSLDPEVVKSEGRPGYQPNATRRVPPPPLAPQGPTLQPPRGAWSNDGMSYREFEETTGIPGLPFPFLRRRSSSGPPATVPH